MEAERAFSALGYFANKIKTLLNIILLGTRAICSGTCTSAKVAF